MQDQGYNSTHYLIWFVIAHQVQESVASCLPPLVPAIKEDAAGIVRNLLQLLLESDKYAERKGAAYGLAGLVKGLGILALKQQDIMTTLTDAIQDKKNFRRREGQWTLSKHFSVWFCTNLQLQLRFTIGTEDLCNRKYFLGPKNKTNQQMANSLCHYAIFYATEQLPGSL